MQYVVSASLQNGKPQLRVVDLETGRVRICWKLEKIQEMFESGEIKREEFLQPQKYGMNLLLKNLFLIACNQNLDYVEQNKRRNINNKPIPVSIWQSNPLMGSVNSNPTPSGHWPTNILMGPMK